MTIFLIRIATSLLLGLAVLWSLVPSARAEELTYEVGVGLGFADGGSSGFDGGWDMMFGVEWRERQKWNIGSQLHVLSGWTSEGDVSGGTDLAYESVALNFTFRPKKPAANWIQLRAGVVYADFVGASESQSGLGWAVGAGALLGGDSKLRVHVFDFSRYQVAGESFNVYSFSFVWCGVFAWY